jgi:hypothetical protein
MSEYQTRSTTAAALDLANERLATGSVEDPPTLSPPSIPPLSTEQLLAAFASLASAISSLPASMAALVPTPTFVESKPAEGRLSLPDQPRAPKLATPPHFTGNLQESQNFLRQVLSNISMNPSAYPSTSHKILFLTSYLKGSAAAWFLGLVRRNASAYVEEQNAARRVKGDDLVTFNANFQFDTSIYPYVLPELTDWEAFLVYFNLNFADPNQRATAERRIRALRQTTSVAAYSSAFQSYCYDLDDTPRRVAEFFYDGLKPAVKDELHLRGKPTMLEPMIQLALAVDTRLMERNFERSTERLVSTTSSHTRISAITDAPPLRGGGPLSAEERKHRFDNRLCLYCGRPDHTVQNCRRREALKIASINDGLDTDLEGLERSGNDSPQA